MRLSGDARCVCDNRNIEAPNVPVRVFANGSLLRCQRTSSPNCRLADSGTGQPSPTEQKLPDTLPQQPTAAPATPAVPVTPPLPQPPEKPRRVITNDDLKGGGGSGFSPMEFSEINDCDRYCFENVRQLARASTSSNPNWKRDLLQAIDRIRSDAEWQTYLRELYDVHLKFCQLGDEKREEPSRDADPHNVTRREIAIHDKYDAKFKEDREAQEIGVGAAVARPAPRRSFHPASCRPCTAYNQNLVPFWETGPMKSRASVRRDQLRWPARWCSSGAAEIPMRRSSSL